MQPIVTDKNLLNGDEWAMEYFEVDSFESLDQTKITQAYAVAYCGEEVVIVQNGKKGTWGLPGGTVEVGETVEETLKREVVEESNCEVKYCEPIGYQKVTNLRTMNWSYQTRFYAEVERLGEFVSDPAGTISQVKYIKHEEMEEYIKWPKIGPLIFAKGKRIHEERKVV